MAEVDLLRSLPHTERDVQKRAAGKDETVVAVAKQFGEMYWDGPRQYGYGGYRYDGAGVLSRGTSSLTSACVGHAHP